MPPAPDSNIFGDVVTTLKDWWIALADEVVDHPHRTIVLIAALILAHVYRFF